MFVPPPHFQTQNLVLGIEPTDICDVTLAWLASRVYYGSSMVGPVRCAPPPTFCHVPTPFYWVISNTQSKPVNVTSTMIVNQPEREQYHYTRACILLINQNVNNIIILGHVYC